MATIVKTIKPSGGDYSSLSAWEAGRQADIAAAGNIEIAECYAMQDTTSCLVYGWTTSASCYIKICTPGSERHTGVYSTSKYRLETSGVDNLWIEEENVVVDGLQCQTTSSADYSYCLALGYGDANGVNIKISNCILKGVYSTNTNSYGFWINDGNSRTGTVLVRNCIAYNCCVGNSTNPAGFRVNYSGVTTTFYNCTAYNCGTGFQTRNDGSDGTINLINCLSACKQANANFVDFGAGINSATYCASSDATADDWSGAGCRINQTFTFTDAANGNFLPTIADAGARKYGTDLSSIFSTDITGAVIPAGYWDIGAFFAPYTVTKTVKASGGDYTSLSAWEAAQQADLPTARTIAIAECYNFVDTAYVQILGWSTSFYFYPKIIGAASDKTAFNTGIYSNERYRLEWTSTEDSQIAINCQMGNTWIDGIQVKIIDGSHSSSIGIGFTESFANGRMHVSNCTVVGTLTGAASYARGIFCNGASNSLKVWNCLVYGFGGAGGSNHGYRAYDSTAMDIYNCTAANCDVGVSRVAGTVTCKNVGVYNCSTAFDGTITQVTCSSTSPTFVDSTNKDFHLATTDTTWAGQGTDLRSDPTLQIEDDIDGGRRSGTWDIGCDQIPKIAVLSYRRTLTINHAYVSGDVQNFPVLVSVTLDAAHVQSSSGHDIVFSTTAHFKNDNMLSWEIESYNSSTGVLLAWVKVPSISASVDTVFYVLYGCATLTSFQGGSKGVWDANYKGVWHLGETGTVTTWADSTGVNNGTNNGATAGTGQVGGGASFNGSSQYIDAGNNASLNINTNSITFWVKFNSVSSLQDFIMKDKGSLGDSPYLIRLDSNNGGKLSYNLFDGTHGLERLTTTALSINVWYFAVATYDGSNARIYLNGSLEGTTAYSYTVGTTTANLIFGQYPGLERWLNGYLDELRISSVARSADWIATEYANQNAPTTFLTASSEVAIAYYRKTITVDYTKCGTADSYSFPVLISMTDADLKTIANSGFVNTVNDILFYWDEDKRFPLNWEIESYTASSGNIIAWVRVPRLRYDANTVFYMFFGDAGVDTLQSVASSVWGFGYQGVYHLGSSTTLAVLDSTANGFNGTNHDATADTGKISGGAACLTSPTRYVDTAANLTSGMFANGITISVWAKFTNFSGWNRAITIENSDDSICEAWLQAVDGNGKVEFGWKGYAVAKQSSGVMTAGTFAYIVGTSDYTQEGTKVYRDGNDDGGSIVGTWPPTSYGMGVLDIGKLRYSGSSYYGNGTFDEVRISSIARSSSYILSEYNNQNAPSTFYSAGTKTTVVGAVASAIKTIMGLALVNTKTIQGLALANVKTVQGLA